MPITMNTFHCPNGHTFEANAKLRARCPECGAGTKRGFDINPLVEKIEFKTTGSAPEVKPKVEPTKPKTGPVLIRQGRPRMAAKKPAPTKPTIRKPAPKPIGAVSAGLVKSHTIKARGTMPTIKRRPVKTALARTVNAGREVVKPYWHGVAEKFGI